MIVVLVLVTYIYTVCFVVMSQQGRLNQYKKKKKHSSVTSFNFVHVVMSHYNS